VRESVKNLAEVAPKAVPRTGSARRRLDARPVKKSPGQVAIRQDCSRFFESIELLWSIDLDMGDIFVRKGNIEVFEFVFGRGHSGYLREAS